MNNGAFGEHFPYTNFHDLNLDWIIKIAKDFLDQYTHIEDVITDGESNLNTIIEQGLENIGNLTDEELEQLQNKTDDLLDVLQLWYDRHIDSFRKRRIVVCGDSYLMDYDYSWGHQLQAMLGLSNDDFFYAGLSGGGFLSLPGATGGVGNGYLRGLQLKEDEITNKDTITDVILCGGLNDSSYTPSNFPTSLFETNVATFISHAHLVFPNAKIWIGYCGNAVDELATQLGTRTIDNRLYAIEQYSKIKSTVPVAINADIWKVFTYTFSWFVTTDYLHPNAQGSIAIATAIMAWITGSPFAIKHSGYTLTRVGSTSVAGASPKSFAMEIDNGMLSIQLNDWYSESGYKGDFIGQPTANLSPGTELHFGNTSNGMIMNKDFIVPVTVAYGNLTGAQKYCPGSLKFEKGTAWKLTIYTTETINSGTSIFIVGNRIIQIPAEYYV